MNKLMFFDQPLETLKEEICTSKYKQFVRLYQECERRIRQVLSPEHPKMSSTFMGITIFNLALMYLLTNEEKYLKHAKRWMLTVCSYKDWGFNKMVNVDLSAAWILFGLSIGYDWLKPYLTNEEQEIIRNKLQLQAEIMYNYKVNTEGAGWSTQYYQNHNWINMTGLSAAGYALTKENSDAKKYSEIGKRNFEKVYQYLADDGSNYEGVAYWRYGGMWLFVYAHLLKTEESIDYFKTCNYLKNTFDYRLYQSSANLLHPVDFGDCHDYYSSHTPAVYYKIASEYQNGYAQKLANLVLERYLYQEALESHVKPGILFEAGLELLWYNPSVQEADFKDLPKTKFFKDLGLLYMRSSWDEEGTVFSVKCGYPGGKKQWLIGWDYYRNKQWKIMSLSHHHPDNNSIILNRRNFPLIIDDGYNREAKPDHHNGIMVDGKIFDVEEKSDIYMHSIYQRLQNDPNYDPVQNYYGEVEIFETNDALSFFQGETHRIYQLDLAMTRVARTIITPQLDYLIMVDHLESKKPHQYTLVANTASQVQPVGKYQYELISGINQMKFTVIPSCNCFDNLVTNHISTIFTPQEPDVIKSEYLNSLQITTEPVKNASFLQVISYHDLGKTSDITVTNLSSDQELGLLIKSPNWTDYYFEGKISNEYFETDATHLFVRYINEEITGLIIIQGSYVFAKGKNIFHNSAKTNIVWSKS